MKHWSAWLSAPVLLLLGALAFWNLQKLEQASPLKTAVAAPEASARYQIKNAQWTRLDLQGQPELSAHAQTMSWYDDLSARMTQPQIDLYANGQAPWKLSAPEGLLPPNSRNILLTGTVLAVGRWPDGQELGFNTARLWLDADQKLLRTDADVSIEGAGRHVLATGLSADWQAQHLRLLSNVQAQYLFPGS